MREQKQRSTVSDVGDISGGRGRRGASWSPLILRGLGNEVRPFGSQVPWRSGI